jgi:uncharacterized membrane protein
MLIFGTIGIFRRYISLPSGFLIFARGLLGGLSVILFVKLRSGHVFRRSGMRHLVWLILTGVLLGSEWIMLFEAYNLTTVAIASLCNYMQPIIVLLLSPLVFKERMTAKKTDLWGHRGGWNGFGFRRHGRKRYSGKPHQGGSARAWIGNTLRDVCHHEQKNHKH